MALSEVAAFTRPQLPVPGHSLHSLGSSARIGRTSRQTTQAEHSVQRFQSSSGNDSLQPSPGRAFQALAGSTGPAVACLGVVAAVARPRRQQRLSRGQRVAQCATPEEWTSRVKAVEGERCLFDVTIPKPLGLTPANFPTRPGVGVAKIAEGGNTDMLNRRVLIDDEPGMWVLEGDEVVAINGTPVEGKSLDEVGPLVKDAEGDSVTLTLCRAYTQGPVKVIFLPSEKMATMKRGSEIRNAAEVGVAELSYSCQEGWCKTCWQTCDMWGTIYRACASQSPKRPPPKNPRTIPEEWNNVVPLKLVSWPEMVRRARENKKQKKLAEEQRQAA